LKPVERDLKDLPDVISTYRPATPVHFSQPTISRLGFQPAAYRLRVDTIEVLNTRSLREDSDKMSVSVALGDGHAHTVTKDLGDLNNGTFAVGLGVGPIFVDKPEIGIAFNYLVVNSGHQSWADIEKALTTAGESLAAAGAKAAAAGVSTVLGTAVLPGLGTILGLAAGWLVDQLVDILFANCDGPVAAEQASLNGQQLWFSTQAGPVHHSTTHPGIDSPTGCRKSLYTVNWTIERDLMVAQTPAPRA
jgi:hypothetical protein